MASRKTRGARDTAKDIILGLAPSGQGPRAPREGVASRQKPRSHSLDTRSHTASSRKSIKKEEPVRRPTQPVQPTVVVDRRPDNSAINGLQAQLAQLQRQNQELIAAEQNSRRRLEANQEALQRRLVTSDTGIGSRDAEELRRNISSVDGKIMSLGNEMNNLRNSLDRQVKDLMQINMEIKGRPAVDPSKIASSTQQLDGKIRDLHGQMMQLKQSLDYEKNERNRDAKTLAENIRALQEIIRQQDKSKTDILNNIARKGDVDKEKLSEEAKRLNEKINLITTEVTRNMAENQARMRDDMNSKFGALETALRGQGEYMAEVERETRRKIDQQNNIFTEQFETINKQTQVDRAKNKDRFHKVNEALAALEHHLEIGNKKIDKIMNSEINARQLHEKGLLAKIQDVENKLGSYTSSLNKTIEDVKEGKQNSKMPQLDIDALRREMEAIAADKNKLSMEGLLKLEEKMTRVQTGLYRDKRDLAQKVGGLDGSDGNRLRGQVAKLDAVEEDMERVQERIRDKVEKQIPNDLNELSAKADNLKHQLNARIDKEEEERYLAIKELQEAFQRLQSKASVDGTASSSVRRDVDECKTAIKKLAESVTTVKNVLDKKITDESRQRASDIARVSGK